MQILRRAKSGYASVSALVYTRHSHWRGSIGAIFWPVQMLLGGYCSLASTHQFAASESQVLNKSWSFFPLHRGKYFEFTLSLDEVNLFGLGPILW
ncbi:hypothetical protein SADUNF_Sadunf10G0183400 [Salix dunnii]|uniref:Uncharacterized protein n=1 Tax=Salix dunnii TaxID=1413687 RepID=A0A835JUT9_9ROSI|nr:hypothetical protein SADUNF_Sadunf10G0183400 [Salix dunnii]